MGSLTSLSKQELEDFLINQTNIEYEGSKLYDGTGTHMNQNPYELSELIEWIRHLAPNYNPKTLLEIGFSTGITNTILNKVFDFDNITAIDHVSLGGIANPSTFLANLKFKPINLIAGDSTEKNTFNRVKALGPYNLLFIDGGHTQEILRSDYANYTRLLTKNSVTIIHDIQSAAFPALSDVWKEIKSKLPANAEVKEFIRGQAKISLGIGAIYNP
tara:strand:+ start:401 stop:1048 length:648 start_codon:yes stop_codon:yes gene_type:complete